MDWHTITDDLIADLDEVRFGPPVTHVYNPLRYAREPYERYLETFGVAPKEVVLLGMNPGPWGMAQTGVPFGEVTTVRQWLGIQGRVGKPPREHPRRPIDGFACRRSEVSGARLWGWARATFGSPTTFFGRFFVANYCPLLFLEASGRNRTPDKLPLAERGPLLAACDRAFRRTVELLQPRWVVGVGTFAEARARACLAGSGVKIGRISHPSPASPAANRGWGTQIAAELKDIGIRLPEKA